ncbi:MAG: TetR/AcrR family transcriptional regulator [Cyanobacteria bacterium P01_A01_bin.3]
MIAKKISGRGRPRQFDLDEAVSTAQHLFHQRGYDGVGVAELSQAIGITAPSLYSAFGSKRQLFEQALQRYAKDCGQWLPEALQSGKTVDAAISNLFARAAEVYGAHSLQRGCLVLEGTRNCTDAEACALSSKFQQATRDLVRSRIAEHYAEIADVLTNYAIVVLKGLSAAAKDGATQAELIDVARIAANGFSAVARESVEDCGHSGGSLAGKASPFVTGQREENSD